MSTTSTPASASQEGPVVNKTAIIEGLKSVNIRAGDVVFVHSSLSSFGRVKDGADAVIDALLETVGPTGTVVMPTFNWDAFHQATHVSFDLAETPSETGKITNVFRLRPQAIRSEHICHSVAAIGPASEQVMGDGVSAWGPGSSFDQFYQLNAWNLFLGVNFASCTALHAVEEQVKVPYREYRSFERSLVILPDGTRRPSRAREFVRKAGMSCDFNKMEPLLSKCPSFCETRIGKARVMNIRIRDIVETGGKCLREDINYLLREDCKP